MLRMPRAQTALGSIESFTQNGLEASGIKLGSQKTGKPTKCEFWLMNMIPCCFNDFDIFGKMGV